jgi:hypothetical protein
VTAETAAVPPAELQTRSWTRRLLLVAIGALALALAAGIYRHGERADARRAAAKNVVLTRETQALERKVAAARANLAATRDRLRAQAPGSVAMLDVLDALTANHSNMSAIVREQDESSAQIIAALGDGRYATYNDLVDRFTTATGTVDALATTETRLRDALMRSTCGNCGALEAAVHWPRR